MTILKGVLWHSLFYLTCPASSQTPAPHARLSRRPPIPCARSGLSFLQKARYLYFFSTIYWWKMAHVHVAFIHPPGRVPAKSQAPHWARATLSNPRCAQGASHPFKKVTPRWSPCWLQSASSPPPPAACLNTCPESAHERSPADTFVYVMWLGGRPNLLHKPRVLPDNKQ